MGALIQKKSKGGKMAVGNVLVKKPATDTTKLKGNGPVIQKLTNPS
jgi:hypothetical protein